MEQSAFQSQVIEYLRSLSEDLQGFKVETRESHEQLRSETRESHEQLRSETRESHEQLRSETRENFESLREETSKNFEWVGRKFAHVDTRFDQIDTRCETLETQLQSLNERSKNHESQLQFLTGILKFLQNEMFDMSKKIKDIYEIREKVKIAFGWQWGLASLMIAVLASGITKLFG